jgi:hypothetical protein
MRLKRKHKPSASTYRKVNSDLLDLYRRKRFEDLSKTDIINEIRAKNRSLSVNEIRKMLGL